MIKSLSLFALLFASQPLLHAGNVPFGHADWKASPTDPVGFAGQGNNWFPGATPPTTWSLGVDGKGQNIRWTVPIPGWTDAQPLVVGKRIVGVYSPHHVVCYDADTGKVLWQDELKLMTLPDRGAAGKPAGPVPDPAKAAKEQLLFERGLAWVRIRMSLTRRNASKQLDMNAATMAGRKPLIEHVAVTLAAWKQDSPDDGAAIEGLVQILQPAVAGDWATFAGNKEGTYIGNAFKVYVEKKCRTRLDNNWQGSVSDVMASPVSDGEIVVVTLGFGQVAAYELATGKRLWAWRDPELKPGSTSHCASPCLWKDLVLVPAAGKVENKQALPSILGVDKRTGVVRWETFENSGHGKESNWGINATHGHHMSPHLMRLPGGRAILVTNVGHLINPETGASLGQLPRVAAGNDNKNDGWGSGFISSVNGILYKGWGGDCGAPPYNAWPISLGPDDKAVIADGFSFAKSRSHGPFALSDRLMVAPFFLDPATGKVIKEPGRGQTLGTVSIAGRQLLSADATSPHPTRKDNRWIRVGSPPVAQLTTAVWDIGDPVAPKRVGENVLTVAGFTPDISAKHFPKAAELYPFDDMIVGHCTYQGIGFNFATDTSGITMHGSRLYLHSPSRLICIGEK